MKIFASVLASALLCCVVAPAIAQEVDSSPLPLKATDAFPKLRIERPIVVTHAGDGSNRLFVASQLGKIHVFPNRGDVDSTTVFLDIESQVVYKDKENEEGFLGLAFHPKYAENGYFYVYYTTTDAPHTSVVSRFRRSADDPNRADPASELELMRIDQPFWNHNGGTIAFGPDGYLYIALGDGGKAGDPFGNGQNLSTWLGSVLRIDVDRQAGGKNYAIPDDNPFVDRDGAKPEIYAYGFRNIWRLSFDRQTGRCWAGDVGQDLWEEIDIVVKGGNYGWNLREGRHPYGPKGVGPQPNLIEPIWEYHHNEGKSITGGRVYRGEKLPQLRGYYLYADYVAGWIRALKYDFEKQQVLENRLIPSAKLPIITFGEDEQGEVYCTTQLGGGIIYRFESTRE
ncbi:MAG: PQQ-dependent sugar dehydrogenase [Planctomycetales bacterium]|nr:PQQ-dependent sugar dehydrogenase [Planctomycetales bacterium]